MKSKVNVESMLLGAALGAIVILCGNAANSQSNTNGRYQLVVADTDIFIIDTTTAQTL